MKCKICGEETGFDQKMIAGESYQGMECKICGEETGFDSELYCSDHSGSRSEETEQRG